MKKSLHYIKSTIGLAAIFALAGTGLNAQDEAPYVLFISENTTAKTSMDTIILREYNEEQKEALREPDPTAWENYENVSSIDELPAAYYDDRFAEMKTLLGLSDDDPADKGFTDLLSAAGYDVYRSQSTFEEDPITGAITEDHEFWTDIGVYGTTEGDRRLSQDQIDRLNAADLIVFSADVTFREYGRGVTNGTQDFAVRDQWNNIETPIIVMNSRLTRSHEWDPHGWGLSYGFDWMGSASSPYDRMEAGFEFPDLRPIIINDDAVLLAGVTSVEDLRVPIYKDYSVFPILPRTNRKFSNNKNFTYPANAKVLLELDIPSFVHPSAGEIETRDPVVIEWQAGVPGYQQQDGVPQPEKIGTPAGMRLYFASGMADTGLYNLSATGETVFLNAVEKYAGPAVADTTWNGFQPDENGWVDTGAWMGWVNVTHAPWIWVDLLSGYAYIEGDSGWVFVAR